MGANAVDRKSTFFGVFTISGPLLAAVKGLKQATKSILHVKEESNINPVICSFLFFKPVFDVSLFLDSICFSLILCFSFFFFFCNFFHYFSWFFA